MKNSIDIFIHVDSKSTIYNKITKREGIYFVEKRVDVRWGTFSQVQATLELLKMTENKNYDYVSLISGQDFPVYCMDNFCDFLDRNKGKLFMEFFPLPSKKWKFEGGIGRLKYHWHESLIYRRDTLTKALLKTTAIISGKFSPKNITQLGKVYGGSQWFTITGEATDFCLAYLRENLHYLNIYKDSLCADELFFQTFFMNSPFKNFIVNNNLRFIKWRKGSGSPLILIEENYDEIIKSGAFFMRKIDFTLSETLIKKCVLENFSNSYS